MFRTSVPGAIKDTRGDKMNDVFIRCLVFLTVLLYPMTSFCDEAVKFRLVQSVYADNKGTPLKIPEGVGCDGKSVVMADTGNARLLKYNLEGGRLTQEKIINVSQLPYPIKVRIGSKGEIFVLDGKSRRIVVLGPEGQFKTILKPEGIPAPAGYVPKSFALDGDNNIYLLDILGSRVLLLNPEGKYKNHIPLPGEAGFISDLLVNMQGEIILIDSVRAVVFSATRDSKSFSPMTKSLKDLMNFPVSMAVDKSGTYYLVDQNGGSVVLLGQDGSFKARKLGMGREEGLLYYPSQICINESGTAFIADRNNNRVQVFE